LIGAVDVCGNLNQINEQFRDIFDQSLTDVLLMSSSLRVTF
jgi:hypothetical protein